MTQEIVFGQVHNIDEGTVNLQIFLIFRRPAHPIDVSFFEAIQRSPFAVRKTVNHTQDDGHIGDNALLGDEFVDDLHFLFDAFDVLFKVGYRFGRDFDHHVHIVDHIVTLALAAAFLPQGADGHSTFGPVFHMFDT